MRPGGDRRHLGDQAEGADPPMLGVRDVQAVVIEGRQRADHAAHHRHRMRVPAKAVVEGAQLLVQHGVVHHTGGKILVLRLVRQLAVQQQIGDLQEGGFLRQLLDRVAAIQQHALVAVDIGDLAFTGGSGAVAGIEGEDAQIVVDLADVGHLRADRAADQRQFGGFVRSIHRDGNRPIADHAIFLVSVGRRQPSRECCPRLASPAMETQ